MSINIPALIARAKAILRTPDTEWRVIDREPLCTVNVNDIGDPASFFRSLPE